MNDLFVKRDDGSTEVTFTHYGWLGFCPILLNNIDSETDVCIDIMFPFTYWLLDLNEWLILSYHRMIANISVESENFDERWCIMVSGELKKPIVRVFPPEPEE